MNEHPIARDMPTGLHVAEMSSDELAYNGQDLVFEMEADRQYGVTNFSTLERVSRLEITVLVLFAMLLRHASTP